MVGWKYQLFFDDCRCGEEVVDGRDRVREMDMPYF